MELDFNPEDDILKADLRIEVITESNGNNPEEAQAVFQIMYYLKVQDIREYTISREPGKVVLHSDLGIILLPSPTLPRGAYCYVPGTGLKDFILPVIDTDSLLNGNLNNKA